jgi:hypothetical protein
VPEFDEEAMSAGVEFWQSPRLSVAANVGVGGVPSENTASASSRLTAYAVHIDKLMRHADISSK